MLAVAVCWPLRVAAQAPEVLVTDTYAEGLLLHGPDLYWKANCGDDFSPALSHVRVTEASATVSGSRSADVVARTLFQPAVCGPDRVASRNIAVDEQYVYWITGDRRVVRLSRYATRGTPATLYTAEPANETGYFLVVSDNYLLWSNGTSIRRGLVDGTSTPQIILDSRAGMREIHDLTAAEGRRFLFLNGRRLHVLTPLTAAAAAYLALPVRGPTEVGAFAVRGNEVFMANAVRGAYSITASALDTSAIRGVFQASSDVHPQQRVDQLAVDDQNVYWHVVVDRRGGPIMRLPHTSTVASPVTDYLLMPFNTGLQSNGRFLFWAENEGIERLLVTAAVTAPITPDIVPFTVRDVSPDRPYGSPGTDYPPYGADPAGRVTSIAVDPGNSAVLYAASERAGVWKSTDGAGTWRQSGTGLRNGGSTGLPGLAIDERNPQRLLYASSNDDFRPGHVFGGLYRSTNGAGSWEHVPLPGCHPDPSVGKVQFGAGRGYAWTRCGVFSSDDLVTWTMMTLPGSTTGINALAVSGRTVFVCSGTSVSRSVDGGRTWDAGSLTLPSACNFLSAAPTDSEPEPVALAMHRAAETNEISLVNFRSGTVRDLRFGRRPGGSGASTVFAARSTGASLTIPSAEAAFDVFASDADYFYQLVGDGDWSRIESVHFDTWMVAFPRSYAPERGSCRAYVATDGGVFATEPGEPGRRCVAARLPWVRAQSGLHAFGSCQVAGAPPSLFLTSPDNGAWVSTTAGVPGASWVPMDRDCCGDNGMLLMDPALPSRVMSGRNGERVVYESPDGTVWPRGGTNIYRDLMVDGSTPPQQATFAQVMTLPGETTPTEADYISAVTPPTLSFFDHIVRNRRRDVGGWQDLSTSPLPRGTVVRVAVSGGHAAPTVYVLTADGQIRRGRVDGSGRIPSWEIISAGLTRAQNMYVNPYTPGVVYVTDTDAIKSTIDDGRTWQAETELTRIATNNAEFRLGCADSFCSLQDLLFVRNNPRVIVAILWPGGVAWSPDAGASWIPVTERLRGEGELSFVSSFADLIARPYSGLYDPTGGLGGEGVLYLALRGRGLVRIDGPFSRLERRGF